MSLNISTGWNIIPSYEVQIYGSFHWAARYPWSIQAITNVVLTGISGLHVAPLSHWSVISGKNPDFL